MKTITNKIIVMALVMCGIVFSQNVFAACNAPTGSNTTAITASSATLNWNTVSNATGYNIRYRIVGAPTWITTTSTTNSKAISSLTASSNYEWQVQTKCSASQTSSWTSSVNFTTLAPPCNVPAGLSTTAITSSGATLSWTAVSGATGYNVRYRIVSTSTWTNTTATSNTKAISSLSASSNYEFQVQTNCGSSNLSAFSGSATFTTLAPPCNTPAGLSSTGITASDATLNWTAVSGAVGYNINYRMVGAPLWTSTTSTTTSTAISSLTGSSNYEWQVQTNCGSSNLSAFSALSTFTTLVQPCGMVTGLSTTNVTISDAELNWTAISGAVGYEIQYKMIGAPSWNQASSASSPFTISGLTPFANYEWQVRSDCGAANFSAFSGSDNFTTNDINALPLSVFHGTWIGTDQQGNHVQVILTSHWTCAFSINSAPDHANNAIVAYRLPEYSPSYISVNGPPSSDRIIIKFFTDNAMHGVLAAAPSSSTAVNSTSITESTIQQIYTGTAFISVNATSGQYEMALYVDVNNFSSSPLSSTPSPDDNPAPYCVLVKQ